MSDHISSPKAELDKITNHFLAIANQITATEPDKAALIREHVAAVKIHYAELEAALIKEFGCTLDNPI